MCIRDRRDIARVDNTQLFPISRVLSHWSGYQTPTAGSSHKFTSACSTMIYRDNLLGKAYQGDTFTCAPVHNLVHRRKLIADGVSFQSQRPTENPDHEFLASTDSWFRPTTVTTGPDGALWVVDMYRLVIEHPEWIDDQREKELFLRAGHDRGRIYRIFPDDSPPRPIVKLSTLDSPRVAELLEVSNGRVRDLAQQELVTRKDLNVTSKLKHLATNSQSEMGRLHALCTLAGINTPDANLLTKALHDKSATVRRHAIRLCEHSVSSGGSSAQLLLKQLELKTCDPDPMVVMQLAYSLGAATGDKGANGLSALALRSLENPYLKAAVVSSLNRENLIAFYTAISKHPSIAKSFRPTMLEMASRMNNVNFLTHVVSELLDQLESIPASPVNMGLLAATLNVIELQKNQMPERIVIRIDKALRHALNMATDPNHDSAVRVAAIELAGLAPNESEQLIELLSVTEPIEVQIATTKAITANRPEEIMKRFTSLSPSVRNAAIEGLLLRKSTASDLLAAVKSKTIPMNSLSLLHRQRLTNHVDKALQAEAKNLFDSSQSSETRTKLIRDYQKVVTANSDTQAGKQLFTKLCGTCHQYNGIGL